MTKGGIRARWKRWGWVKRILFLLFFFLVPAPILALLVFRFLPIPGTPAMLVSLVEGKGVHYRWRSDLSPRLGRAVIAAEDQNFCSHYGFDIEAINKAIAEHRRDPSEPLRGASTVSQQTARTLFLGYRGGWVRKGVETYLTLLLEALWPKERIMTAYLNLVDWGDGIFGAQAAAEHYFGADARRLSSLQAARLVAVLPNPHRWSASRPGPYVQRRTASIQGRSAMVVRDGLNFCLN
jgi:monofunctional biosynthetic peptidoglycan transglycosylase